jgi:hypothetical protein
MLHKLAAMTSVLTTAVLVVSSITTFIEEFQKLDLNKTKRSPKLLQGRQEGNPSGTILSNQNQPPSRIVDNNYPRKVRQCRICEARGYTEWHHIISQGHARKSNQHRLITNPGNVVELCKKCHNQTTASKSWYIFENKKKNKKKTNRLW